MLQESAKSKILWTETSARLLPFAVSFSHCTEPRMRFTCGYPFPVGGGGGGGAVLCARFFGVGHYGEQREG